MSDKMGDAKESVQNKAHGEKQFWIEENILAILMWTFLNRCFRGGQGQDVGSDGAGSRDGITDEAEGQR